MSLPHRIGSSPTVVLGRVAGLVGTRNIHRLIRHSTRVGAKLVLVSDHRQLPEIDAGGLFRELAETIGSVNLAARLCDTGIAEGARAPSGIGPSEMVCGV